MQKECAFTQIMSSGAMGGYNGSYARLLTSIVTYRGKV